MSGTPYYEYICTWVDDLSTVMHNATSIMREIGSVYKLKVIDWSKEPWDPQKRYLGADCGDYELSNGTKAWHMSSESYVKAAIKTVKSWLSEEDKQLTRIAKAPPSSRYQPELDVLDILGPDATNWFQNIIRILNWIVELGRVDINNSVERLTTFLSIPRAGNLRASLHMFSYLDHYDRTKLVFDPSMPSHIVNFNKVKNCQEHYPYAEDDFPLNMPDSLGPPVRITCFLDSDHTGDQLTRSSYYGILIYINSALISWFIN